MMEINERVDSREEVLCKPLVQLKGMAVERLEAGAN